MGLALLAWSITFPQGQGVGYTAGWTQLGQAHVGLLPTQQPPGPLAVTYMLISICQLTWLPPHAAFWLESSSAERDLGVLVGTKLTMARHGMEGQWYPGLHEEEGCQQVKGGDPSPLLCPGETQLEC